MNSNQNRIRAIQSFYDRSATVNIYSAPSAPMIIKKNLYYSHESSEVPLEQQVAEKDKDLGLG